MGMNSKDGGGGGTKSRLFPRDEGPAVTSRLQGCTELDVTGILPKNISVWSVCAGLEAEGFLGKE